MDCNCIKDLRKAIKKEYGEDASFTNIHITFNIKNGEMGESFEPITFKYHPKKADGTFSKKWDKKHIVFSFCPICGKKISLSKKDKKE